MSTFLDFLIIGPPKTGTTSLYNQLVLHPEIEGSSPKEPFFFIDSHHPRFDKKLNIMNGLEGYHKFFPEDCKRGNLKFEATTHTYYQQSAIDYFSTCEKKPLVIFIKREPADRIRSSFYFTKHKLANIDQALSFNRYVHLLLENKCEKFRQFYYSDSSYWVHSRQLKLSNYKKWITEWERTVGKQNLKIIDFESLKINSGQVLNSICTKLDINEIYSSDDLKRDNKTFYLRDNNLHRHLLKANAHIGDIIPFKALLKKTYFKFQKKEKKQSEDEEGLELLRKYFKSVS